LRHIFNFTSQEKSFTLSIKTTNMSMEKINKDEIFFCF